MAPELYGRVLKVSKYGVLPRGDRPPVRFPQTAYANINDKPQATADELWGDVLKGRLMLFAERSASYSGDIMGPKLAYVLQKDATNPDTMKDRYISDPRNEANDRIDNDRRPQCVMPRHRNVARRIGYWGRRYHPIPILIPKRDVKGAFKLLPVSIRGLEYMGCLISISIAMYLAMFFGWRPSPANWGLISTLLMQYVAAFRPRDEYIDGPETFVAFHYVDDGACVEPWAGMRHWQAVALWEHALTTCLGHKSMHRKKREVEGNSDTTIPLWGIIVSAGRDTLSLPSEKLADPVNFWPLAITTPAQP